MAYASVGEAKHSSSNGSVNGKSEFGETPRKHWWQRAPQSPPTVAERDTYPQWDAPTQAIPAVPARRPAPQVLYRERPADLDTAACNIALVATGATLHRHSAIKFEENLAKHLKMVHALAQQERAEGQKLLERHERTADTPSAAAEGIREVVRAEERANGLAGVAVRAEIDTEAYGRDLGAAWSNAHALNDETAQFQPITPGMPDPRVTVKVEAVAASTSPSPVHVPGEELRPAIPDEQEEDADPGASSPLARTALPKRHKIVSFAARMSAVPGVPAHGSEYTAAELLVMHGAWMLARGAWSLVESASLDADTGQVLAHPAESDEVVLAPGASVWLLAPGEAAGLAEAFRAELNEAESSR